MLGPVSGLTLWPAVHHFPATAASFEVLGRAAARIYLQFFLDLVKFPVMATVLALWSLARALLKLSHVARKHRHNATLDVNDIAHPPVKKSFPARTLALSALSRGFVVDGPKWIPILLFVLGVFLVRKHTALTDGLLV